MGIPRWSADRLPAVVVMDFRMLGNLGYLEPRDRFYNENTATPVPAVRAGRSPTAASAHEPPNLLGTAVRSGWAAPRGRRS